MTDSEHVMHDHPELEDQRRHKPHDDSVVESIEHSFETFVKPLTEETLNAEDVERQRRGSDEDARSQD